MSGGSFNYLCWNTDEIGSRKEDVRNMADALAGMDDPSAQIAARSTRTVLNLIEAAEETARRLEDVWHAVEWWKSCDYSQDQALEAVRKYAPWPPEPEAAP